jgi:hypothetical protein
MVAWLVIFLHGGSLFEIKYLSGALVKLRPSFVDTSVSKYITSFNNRSFSPYILRLSRGYFAVRTLRRQRKNQR